MITKKNENEKTLYNRKLKYYRKQAGLTQRELAELIGKSPKWVSRLENSDIKPSLLTQLNICIALKVPIKYFYVETNMQMDFMNKLENLTADQIKILFSLLESFKKSWL